ncbi:hypothetical protein HHL16_17460 [Pseudoflavitalea sp. G-6-1-2]|uniref:hypothetical protein n=1 Tax=Pseudoflavitalea sp. G-6-1-2 TaxID=2728841 RepID=UPI00146DF2A0|nr:hypothetical protein [Pseudoflavitalea sp. G-6-1-2]NML22675.1 hypothetical protein [Pseudoflavitalea sp. G-6-1-2]
MIAGLLSGLQIFSDHHSTDLSEVNQKTIHCDSASKHCTLQPSAVRLATAGTPVSINKAISRYSHLPEIRQLPAFTTHLLNAFLLPVNMLLHVRDNLMRAILRSPLCPGPNLSASSLRCPHRLPGIRDTLEHPWSLCFGTSRNDSVSIHKKDTALTAPIASFKTKQLLYFLWQSYLQPFRQRDTSTDAYSLCRDVYQPATTMRTKDTITDPYALYYDDEPDTMWKKENRVNSNRYHPNTRNQQRFLYFHSRRLSPHAKLVDSAVPVR